MYLLLFKIMDKNSGNILSIFLQSGNKKT